MHFNQNSVGIGDLARGLIYLGFATNGKGVYYQLVGIATRMSMEINCFNFRRKDYPFGQNAHIKICLQHRLVLYQLEDQLKKLHTPRKTRVEGTHASSLYLFAFGVNDSLANNPYVLIV